MSKKMKIIPSMFKNKQHSKYPWQWPSCKHTKTLSFRGHGSRCDDHFPTTAALLDVVGAHEPSTSNSSTSSAGNDEDAAAPPLEVVISGGRLSERLFFEPEETSSIVRDSEKGGKTNAGPRRPFKDSVAMAMESEDPYLDFKKSMEEMVESQGLFKDWDCLEELLLWYLRMNGKINHRFIVGAFVDLLVGFAAMDSKTKTKTKTMMVSGSDSTSTTTYYSSASSSFSSISSPLSRQDQLS